MIVGCLLAPSFSLQGEHYHSHSLAWYFCQCMSDYLSHITHPKHAKWGPYFTDHCKFNTIPVCFAYSTVFYSRIPLQQSNYSTWPARPLHQMSPFIPTNRNALVKDRAVFTGALSKRTVRRLWGCRAKDQETTACLLRLKEFWRFSSSSTSKGKSNAI